MSLAPYSRLRDSTDRPLWLVGGFAVVAGALAGLSGRTDLGVSILLLGATLLLLFSRPAAFLGIAMGLYGSMQSFLEGSLTIGLGGLTMNAARIYILTLSAAMGIRLLASFVTERTRPTFPRSVIAAFSFSAWMILALLNSAHPSEGAANLARIISCTIALAFSFVFVRTWRDFVWVWGGAAMTTIVASGHALFEFAGGRALGAISVGSHRAEGGFGGAVATGTVAFFGLALSVGILMAGERLRRHRVFACVTLAASVIGMFATFTRTALLGTIVFAGLLLLFSPASRARSWSFSARALIIVFIATTLVGGAALVGEDAIESRLADVPGVGAGGSGLSAESGSGRGLIWATCISQIASNDARQWLLGRGVMSVAPDMQKIIGLYVGAHNSYLAVLYEAGLPALVLYLFFAFSMLADLKRAADKTSSASCSSLLSVWHVYYVSFFLSTVMFNGFVYMIGSRWYSMIIAGSLLGLATAFTEDHSNSEATRA